MQAGADGTGENRIPHESDERGILAPIADHIGDSVGGMPRGIPVGDAQAAELEEIIGAIPLLREGGGGIGVDMHLGILFP